MHLEASHFCEFVKNICVDFFHEKCVLDVGSGDINGNNRHLFENCEYNGNDVIAAKNVTIVSKTKDLPFIENTFDTIISTECFEHDPEYKQSLVKIYDMLKPDGLFLFTCASSCRNEHGTKRTSPYDSYGTIGNLSDMSDYYKNLTELDLNDALNLNELFSVWDTYYNHSSKDLYFLGIKKGNNHFSSLPKYLQNDVCCTSHNIGTQPSLDFIFSKYSRLSDKGPHFHNYTRQYEKLLTELRNKPVKYLEIGVHSGGSLMAMREAFKNATCILGLDVNPDCKNVENVNYNICVEIGDATNRQFIKKITEKYGTFDIILDDGSHRNSDVIKTFELLFPLLNDNGLYIIEDTICFKSPDHLDPNYENHLHYFFKYTAYLNQWRFDSTNGVNDHCIDPFKIKKKTTNVFEHSIDKIEYGCSYIAISKKIRKHWI
jgi:SAM-dependent methyltransferase